MPELPEVETVRAGIADHGIGRTITAVEVHVVTGGGSFGHKLFPDHAVEAAREIERL